MIDDVAELKALIEKHAQFTGSEVAKRVLADWNGALAKFVKVMPVDYKRVLLERANAQRESAKAVNS